MRPSEVNRRLEAVVREITKLKDRIKTLEGLCGSSREKLSHQPVIAVKIEHKTDEEKNEISNPVSLAAPETEPTKSYQRNADKAPKPPIYRVILEIVAVVLSAAAALAYYLQLNEMQKATRISERPWIVVTFTKPQINEGKPVQTSARISNRGKTPAIGSTGKFVVEIVPRDKAPTLDVGEKRAYVIYSSGILYPSDGRDFATFGFNDKGNQAVFDKAAIDNLVNGANYVAVFGKIEYSDTFGTGHWATVCEWFDYEARPDIFASKPCVQYNQADANSK